MTNPRRVVLLAAVALFPIGARAQIRPSVEFGPTWQSTHHTFRARYPGERGQEGGFGLRADIRVLNTPLGMVGVALTVDRYSYSQDGYICIAQCTNDISRTLPNGWVVIPLRDPWRVTRVGGGISLDRALLGPLHASVGILGGESRRVPQGDLAMDDYNQFHRREWFAGVEGSVSVRWRDLSIGAGGEYGRVPNTYYAPEARYGRVTARVAYVIPVGIGR